HTHADSRSRLALQSMADTLWSGRHANRRSQPPSRLDSLSVYLGEPPAIRLHQSMYDRRIHRKKPQLQEYGELPEIAARMDDCIQPSTLIGSGHPSAIHRSPFGAGG